jgi:hypothetical protein
MTKVPAQEIIAFAIRSRSIMFAFENSFYQLDYERPIVWSGEPGWLFTLSNAPLDGLYYNVHVSCAHVDELRDMKTAPCEASLNNGIAKMRALRWHVVRVICAHYELGLLHANMPDAERTSCLPWPPTCAIL